MATNDTPPGLSFIQKISQLSGHTPAFAKFVWDASREDSSRGKAIRVVLVQSSVKLLTFIGKPVALGLVMAIVASLATQDSEKQ